MQNTVSRYDLIIVGSGPAGLGAAFAYRKRKGEGKILILEKEAYCTGGLRNDCKMNFTYPVGFPVEYWDEDTANRYLQEVEEELQPTYLSLNNLETYKKRAQRLGVTLLPIRQSHLGTDGGKELVGALYERLTKEGVQIHFNETLCNVFPQEQRVLTDAGTYLYKD
ncbi:MAG: FAD-binding protein, partial [Spirochaetales bacterium]